MILLDIQWDSMHQLLRSLYDEMLPLCSQLIGIARAIGGIGAIFYIANRVWRHMANNEPIDFYPLFRPFVIGFCIGIFPLVLASINGIMNPVVTVTEGMVEKQNVDIAAYTAKRDAIEKEAYESNGELYVVDDKEYQAELDKLGITDVGKRMEMMMERTSYQIKKSVRDLLREILDFLYQGVSLVIDTIRTFFLIVLAIIGPISFALSIFDGFQSTLTNWIARYVQISLWLPVSNIFGTMVGKIQVLMLDKSLADMQANMDSTFDATDTGYMIFMLIAIVGYCTVPTVSSFIIQSTGGAAALGRMNAVGGGATAVAGAAGGAAGGAIAGRATSGASNVVNAPKHFLEGYNSK
ncbi:conjugative transposon protein TraJ [Pedobacter sp. P351]|uniref:conjugative transposon protein TraJ n=1 Tax=Pedobacter superstes TaxID=3133441 RepID=UPI0030AA2FD8